MTDLEGIAELGGAAAVEMVASALADHGAHGPRCPNCSAPVIGPYCAACGQEHKTHRRSVWHLLHDAFREIASFDSRILRTATALAIRPGELSLAFQEGRTRRYMPALRLYLFVSLIFFIVLDLTGIALVQLQLVPARTVVVTTAGHTRFVVVAPEGPEQVQLPKDVQGVVQPGEHFTVAPKLHFFARIGSVRSDIPAEVRARIQDDRQRMDKAIGNDARSRWFETRLFGTISAIEADPAALNGAITRWIPRMLFLLLPLFALLLAAFYWRQRKRFYFVDHLVFSLNAHSFLFVALLMAAGLTQVLPGGLVAELTIGGIALYLFLAMKHFYRQGWFWTGIKFASISFIYFTMILVPALSGVVTVSVLGI